MIRAANLVAETRRVPGMAIEDALKKLNGATGLAAIMTHRPAVVAFDVIETLMSLEPLRERLTGSRPASAPARGLVRPRCSGTAWRCPRPGTSLRGMAGVLRGLTSYTISDEQVAQIMA